MMADESDKGLDKPTETQTKSSETALAEADAGKPELVAKQKELIDYLKAGGTSGVTGEIGKPTFFDSELAPKVIGKDDPTLPTDTAPPPPKMPLDGPPIGPEPAGDYDPHMFRIPGKPETYKNVAEIINKDVEPGEHTVKKNDTLWKISKDHLGKDATNEEVYKHVQEIARVNAIKDPNVIHPGEQLILPGHTEGGGFVLKQGSEKVTYMPDGLEQHDLKDGTGYIKEVGADGKATEYHYGATPSDVYTLKPQPDGTYQGTDDAGNKHTKKDDGTEQVDFPDGRGYKKIPDGTGDYTEEHFGKNKGDTYTLTPQPDGSYQGTDDAGNKHTRDVDGNDHVDYPNGTKAVTDKGGRVTSITEKDGKTWTLDPASGDLVASTGEKVHNAKMTADGGFSCWDKTGTRFEHKADGSIKESHLLDRRGDVSDEFAKKVEDTIEAMPQKDRDDLEKQGYKIIAAKRTIDADPSLVDDHPRDWPPGQTWENSDGGRFGKKIVVAETHKVGDDYVPSTRTEGVLRHETGHAVDSVKDGHKDQAFKDAYAKDVAAMDPETRKKLEYFLQEGDAGPEETYANVYATLRGGTPNPQEKELFEKHFPNVVKAVKEREEREAKENK